MISLILFYIAKLFKRRKSQYIITLIMTIILIAFFCFNFVYYKLLEVPFSISTITLASQAMEFYKIGFQAFFQNIGYLCIFIIPLILLIVFHNKLDFTNYHGKKINLIYEILIAYIIAIISLIPFKDTGYKYYFKNDNILASIDTYGLITSQRLSVQRYIFGFEDEIILEGETNDKQTYEEMTYELNTLDIDFNKLANSTEDETEKSLYQYFDSAIYTSKNEYTGMYKDKNLIFILAEGFNSIAVDKELTPTLYKLTHTGFVFNNYYSPVFLSTTGGEFQATTGLIPTQEILGLWRKNNPTFTFALGNSFKNLGYTANAYHDWTYTYYKRNLTMPTLGFDNYMGCKNGMENLIDCDWLPSDIDMINKTSSLYMNEDKFITYYVSVSGHAPYNFTGGNSIDSKNKKLVENLPYSDSVKSYLAGQIEFDRAIEALINNLDKAGKLDDTVIVITGDHYPYTLTEDEINEVSTYKRDELFEVNHSNLIIWNNNDDIVEEVDKVSSQIDVLPTILNLFGVDYDSRMIIGNDILSDTEGLAIFSNHSWISDSGRYNSNTKEFTSTNDNKDQDYVNNMNIRVDNSFIVSKMILETDIYKKVLGDK
jgi:phosphoglycerol transferase MdoB-like AlkP superfamily enzyme